jgi:membrane protein YdbS with pleckstrin-like domain
MRYIAFGLEWTKDENARPGRDRTEGVNMAADKVRFDCPHCGRKAEGDTTWYGQTVPCPFCNGDVIIPANPGGRGSGAKVAKLYTDDGMSGPAPVTADTAPESGPETDIHQWRPSWAAYLKPILIGSVLFFLAVCLLFVDLGVIVRYARLAVLLVGAVMLGWVWIEVHSTDYRLTTQRLFIKKGWLAKDLDELELFRVKDVELKQTVLDRILGIGTIVVYSTDDSNPKLELVGTAKPNEVKEKMRAQYRVARRREGIRATEFITS